jgi:hypothetical protein
VRQKQVFLQRYCDGVVSNAEGNRSDAIIWPDFCACRVWAATSPILGLLLIAFQTGAKEIGRGCYLK